MKKLYVAMVAVVLVVVVIVGLSFATFVPLLSPAIHSATSDEKTVIVNTESMEPAIINGATLYYKPVPYEQIAVNDIILFKKDSEPMMIVARVTNITINGLTVKGDTNPEAYVWMTTEYVTSNEVVGKVTQIHNP